MKNQTKHSLPFTKENYKLFAIGFGVIILGYILLSGGAPEDPKVFNPEVFSFTRITLAPLTILAGFGILIYSIIKKSKD